MSHIIELKDCNIVIVASSFNIPIINTVWLYRNKIFTEEELQGASCLPVVVEIQTDLFRFNLVPERLQFSVNPSHDAIKTLILLKIGKLIKLLPHTPFVAAGLNFVYQVAPEGDDIYTLSRSIFYNEKAKLFKGLDAKNVRFGGYFSQDLMGTRFRLDVKPVSLKTKEGVIERLQFSYNFNVNLTNDGHEEIIELFNKWDDAKKVTEEYTSKVN